MRSEHSTNASRQEESCEHNTRITRLLVLPDGRVLAHNLTTAMAEILQLLDPNDQPLLERGRLRHGRRPPAPSASPTPASGTP